LNGNHTYNFKRKGYGALKSKRNIANVLIYKRGVKITYRGSDNEAPSRMGATREREGSRGVGLDGSAEAVEGLGDG
jgi:hypothetical protein